MRRVLAAVGILVVLALGGIAVFASGGANDGPYFVVDPLLDTNDNTSHVYTTLTAALAELRGLAQEAWGATIILLPGEHAIAAGGAQLDIPGLLIKSRDGAEKTQIVCADTAISVLARDTTLEGIKIIGANANPGAVGVSIAASGCTLREVIVESWPDQGITADSADGLVLQGVQILSCKGNGLEVKSSLGLVVRDSRFVANNGNGVEISGSDGAAIRSSEISGNKSGLVIKNSRDIEASDIICSTNTDDGISLEGCSWATISGNTCDANGGNGIRLFEALDSQVTGNNLGRNTGGGVKIIDSVGCSVKENAIGETGGTPGATPPAVPGISLEGASVSCSVEENEVANHAYGIALLVSSTKSPSGCVVASNVLSNLTQVGLYVASSAGGNRLERNQITAINQDGIRVEADGDLVLGNAISDAGAYGINLNAANNVLLRENEVATCGRIGILISNSRGVRIEACSVTSCSEGGISANGADSLVVSNCTSQDHEGYGLMLGTCKAASLRRNIIRRNNLQGIVVTNSKDFDISPWNDISTNRTGGIAVDATSTGLVKANLIYGNLGFGLSTTNPAIEAGVNWWGSAQGPSGLFAGQGNAILGFAATPKFAAPILPAPPRTSGNADAAVLADYTRAQVGFITTFASGKVTVNRLDTAAVRLAFTGVDDRASAWVNTVPLEADALADVIDEQPAGSILCASSILVTGLNHEGTVEISMTDHATSIESALLFAYVGGAWAVDSSGKWTLSGGQWVEASNCTYDGSSLVIGEITVSSLLGESKVIALVNTEAEPEI